MMTAPLVDLYAEARGSTCRALRYALLGPSTHIAPHRSDNRVKHNSVFPELDGAERVGSRMKGRRRRPSSVVVAVRAAKAARRMSEGDGVRSKETMANRKAKDFRK
jgi:hypothetical protein